MTHAGSRLAERGQILPLVGLVLLLAGVSLVAGAGDIAVAQHEHERADEAATLGALSGAGVPLRASIYGGTPALDPGSAVAACLGAVRAVAPEAVVRADTCAVDGNDPLRRRMVVTVEIDVRLPIPVPFVGPVVRSQRIASLSVGAQTAS